MSPRHFNGRLACHGTGHRARKSILSHPLALYDRLFRRWFRLDLPSAAAGPLLRVAVLRSRR
jgi:hypothetical protein